MEKVWTTTWLIFHILHLMGKFKHIFKKGAHTNNVFIYINATSVYPSCFCSCLIIFFVWFSSVFHRSADHPLGRTYPPHPVLCPHREGMTMQRKIHFYLSYLITYSYCVCEFAYISHDPPLYSVLCSQVSENARRDLKEGLVLYKTDNNAGLSDAWDTIQGEVTLHTHTHTHAKTFQSKINF